MPVFALGVDIGEAELACPHCGKQCFHEVGPLEVDDNHALMMFGNDSRLIPGRRRTTMYIMSGCICGAQTRRAFEVYPEDTSRSPVQLYCEIEYHRDFARIGLPSSYPIAVEEPPEELTRWEEI